MLQRGDTGAFAIVKVSPDIPAHPPCVPGEEEAKARRDDLPVAEREAKPTEDDDIQAEQPETDNKPQVQRHTSKDRQRHCRDGQHEQSVRHQATPENDAGSQGHQGREVAYSETTAPKYEAMEDAYHGYAPENPDRLQCQTIVSDGNGTLVRSEEQCRRRNRRQGQRGEASPLNPNCR